ncbi:hypothetical protein BGX38DRAFT_1170280 [Terfezia claveryi]|nr:hypothetical protein BGX38DRAFT_1170280 [Terfezia claveryi]
MDSPNDFVLLRVNPSSQSSAPLDAYLLATEGEAAYGLKINNSGIHKFLHKAFTGTHEEFRAILSSLLLGTPVKGEDKRLLEGFGTSATIEGGTITLAVRKSVGGIKQRIAAINIPQTEDEIELYNWVGEACMARDESESKLQAQEKRVNELEKDVEKLITQLKDLRNLKKEHEDAMLVKFQELLNSKKQHIRELTGLVDAKGRQNNPIVPDTTPEAAPSKTTAKGKNPRKRAAAPVEEEDESDGDFAMAIDKADDDEEDEVDSDQRSDPRTTEDEAEVETSGDEEPQHSAAKIKKKPTASAKGKGKAATTAASRRKASSTFAPAKTPARYTRAGSKKHTTAKAATATRGRGRPRGKQTVKTPEPEESAGEKASSPEPSLPPAPHEDSDATAGATDDDEL